MKLVTLSMVKNEEYWIWYSLSSVYHQAEELLVFDNFSDDRTVEIIRGMDQIADKLVLFERFGGPSEHDNRESMLDVARQRGATHVLFLDGDEVHVEKNLRLCRQLLEAHEHDPPLQDPPSNHGRPMDHTPTDGVLIRNIGFKPIHPGFAGPDTCRPHDLAEPDTSHGCYNFAIPISALSGLHGNGLEWGRHGYLEADDMYIQSSPHTLWLPGLWYYHFSFHPRSSLREPGSGNWVRPVTDLGSVMLPGHVHPPEVLFRPDGPGNPTLEMWGLRAKAPLATIRR
ncbi:MAG: glycosyltransferase family 2 protein [Planctomycetota bacterium]|jgi:glycosyltransferase involved in cell wall biosynthesis